MKTPLALALALLAVAPLSAQVFRPQTVNGAVIGGIAGAVIGNNSGSLGHNAWKGAAIGAVAGGVIGSLSADERDRRGGGYHGGGGYYGGGGYVYRPSPVVYGGYYRGGYGPYRGGYYGSYYGNVGYYPSYGYYGPSSYASDGLLLGAVAGGIIGHNSGSLHHNGWRGAAWGAGIGWLLGSVADANRRAVISEQPVYVQPAVQQQAAPAAQPAAQPQQVTIINNYYGNAAPMSQANGLFGR